MDDGFVLVASMEWGRVVGSMTTLRQQFIRELVLRGMAPRTQDAYVAAVYGVAKHYHQSPEQLSDEQLKEYMFHLARDKDLAYSTLNEVVSGLRCFVTIQVVLVERRPVRTRNPAQPSSANPRPLVVWPYPLG